METISSINSDFLTTAEERADGIIIIEVNTINEFEDLAIPIEIIHLSKQQIKELYKLYCEEKK